MQVDMKEFKHSIDMNGEILSKALACSIDGDWDSLYLVDSNTLYDSLTEEQLAYILTPSNEDTLKNIKEGLLKVSVERCLLGGDE